MNGPTTNIERVSFARVFVEVSAEKDLPSSMQVQLEDGLLVDQKFEYEWLPPSYQNCCRFDHVKDQCTLKMTQEWRVKGPSSSADSVSTDVATSSSAPMELPPELINANLVNVGGTLDDNVVGRVQSNVDLSSDGCAAKLPSDLPLQQDVIFQDNVTVVLGKCVKGIDKIDSLYSIGREENNEVEDNGKGIKPVSTIGSAEKIHSLSSIGCDTNKEAEVNGKGTKLVLPDSIVGLAENNSIKKSSWTQKGFLSKGLGSGSKKHGKNKSLLQLEYVDWSYDTEESCQEAVDSENKDHEKWMEEFDAAVKKN